MLFFKNSIIPYPLFTFHYTINKRIWRRWICNNINGSKHKIFLHHVNTINFFKRTHSSGPPNALSRGAP